jgi:DNA-binding response OmpR family regulator
MARTFIAIVGHGPDLEREEGAANILRGLGAEVRTLDLWDEPARLFGGNDEIPARVIVIEALDRPDLAAFALRALRREPRLEGAGALVAVTAAQAARIEPTSGFDDFVLHPYVPAELYGRIRWIEWHKSEFANEERMKVGSILIDRAAREVAVGGAEVELTAKEFSLLAYLCERRGKVVSREELLRKVWGNRYEGGARTVDIHVRRLRAKLGSALPLATLRGAGYKLATPDALPQPSGESRAATAASATQPATPAAVIGSPRPAIRSDVSRRSARNASADARGRAANSHSGRSR